MSTASGAGDAAIGWPFSARPFCRTTASRRGVIHPSSTLTTGRPRSRSTPLMEAYRRVVGARRTPDSKGGAGSARPSARRFHSHAGGGEDEGKGDDHEGEPFFNHDEHDDQDGNDGREPARGDPGRSSAANRHGRRRHRHSAGRGQSRRARISRSTHRKPKANRRKHHSAPGPSGRGRPRGSRSTRSRFPETGRCRALIGDDPDGPWVYGNGREFRDQKGATMVEVEGNGFRATVAG